MSGPFQATFGYTDCFLSGLFQATFGYTAFGRPPPHFLHPPATEHKLVSSGMTVDDVPRKIVGLRVQHEVPDLRESLVYNRQKLSVDAGCFMGRSFRVGWGPGWTLVHAGSPCVAEEEGRCKMVLFFWWLGHTVCLFVVLILFTLFVLFQQLLSQCPTWFTAVAFQTFWVSTWKILVDDLELCMWKIHIGRESCVHER